MMTKLSYFHSLFTVLNLCVCANSYPYFFLDKTEPKCIAITAAHESTILVQYDAPDLITTDSTQDAIRRAKEQQQKQNQPLNPQHGLDARYQRRLQENLEAAQQASIQGEQPHVMNLTIRLQGIYVDSAGSYDYYSGIWQHAAVEPEAAVPIQQLLTMPKGFFTFETGTRNGMVEICVQSNRASATKPVRVGLNITEKSTFEYEAEKQRKQELAREKRKLLDEQHRLAEDHMYQISYDLKGLDYKLQFIVNHADYKVQHDEAFRLKYLRLNRQVTIWPKVQLVMLFVTSIWQARHIIRFFKRHYI